MNKECINCHNLIINCKHKDINCKFKKLLAFVDTPKEELIEEYKKLNKLTEEEAQKYLDLGKEYDELNKENKNLKDLLQVMQRDFNILYEKLGKIEYLIYDDVSTISCECCTKNNDVCSKCFKSVIEEARRIIDEVD